LFVEVDWGVRRLVLRVKVESSGLTGLRAARPHDIVGLVGDVFEGDLKRMQEMSI